MRFKISAFIMLLLLGPSLAYGRPLQEARRRPTPLNNEQSAPQPIAPNQGRAPELRGFRLGQSVDEILGRFPGLRLINNKFRQGFQWDLDLYLGAYEGRLGAPITNNDSGAFVDTTYFPGFEGIKHTRMKFTEGRLTTYQIEYDNESTKFSLDEFRAKMAEALGLASEVWKPMTWPGSLRVTSYKLERDNFTLGVTTGYQSMLLSVSDVATEQQFEKRQEEQRRKQEEERKGKFKP